jgi:hypothetical protein
MKTTLSLVFLWTIIGMFSPLTAPAGEATETETIWFAGEWTVAPAPVEGYDTIIAKRYPNVQIEHRGGTRIARISTLRHGERVTVEFEVRSFGGNYPWWSATGGGNLIARRVNEDTFDLAGVGAMGKADWAHALRHTRVKHAADDNP